MTWSAATCGTHGVGVILAKSLQPRESCGAWAIGPSSLHLEVAQVTTLAWKKNQPVTAKWHLCFLETMATREALLKQRNAGFLAEDTAASARRERAVILSPWSNQGQIQPLPCCKVKIQYWQGRSNICWCSKVNKHPFGWILSFLLRKVKDRKNMVKQGL